MEEGSLLQHVLQRQSQEDVSATEAGEQNVIILDIFSLKLGLDHVPNLLSLAELANQCNELLQSRNYAWHCGGDGPVFGTRVGNDGIPHLRAYCTYGPNVQDEWTVIDFMFQLSEEIDYDFAISCWDVDDGQVILIQTAEVLPEWLDDDSSDNHRYACFVRKGKIQLLQKPNISLPDAIKTLQSQSKNATSSHPRIQNRMMQWLEINRQHTHSQAAPFVVPRKVAMIMRQRPDLVHAAIQAFCKNIEEIPPSISNHEDWVWTTHELNRTNYAMARTMVSKEWKSSEYLPRVPIEVKRYKRQCAMESTPHLKYAVQLGVRLVVGFEYLAKSKLVPPSIVERVAHWCRLEQDCTHSDQGSWILESFKQGPNHSIHDLSYILKCPVFPEEREFPTHWTNSNISLQQQLVIAQKDVDEEEDFPMPLSNDVGDESWLVLEGGDGVSGNKDLDAMLSKFQDFMVQPAGPEGVSSSTADTNLKVRPHIFMNILHSVLKGESLTFPRSDPYFYDEDYDLMEEDSDENKPGGAMKGIMVRYLLRIEMPMLELCSCSNVVSAFKDAMDAELKGKSESRKLDTIDGSDAQGAGDHDEELAEDAHLLNNLLQSLEASDGTAGPVSNMMKDMSRSALPPGLQNT